MTETVFTRRCNARERKAFRRSPSYDSSGNKLRGIEPALGTLEERLDIIRNRFGPLSIRLTRDERDAARLE